MDLCLSDVATTLGRWLPDDRATLAPADVASLSAALAKLVEPVQLVRRDGVVRLARGGEATLGRVATDSDHALVGYVSPLRPEQLGDPGFRAAHGVDRCYVAGAMANGIASEELVEAIARAGMLGFFGAAGLSPSRVDQALDRLTGSLGTRTFGVNLIHSPNEPELEDALVDLYLRRGVRRISASAYMGLSLPVVRYRVHGIHRDPETGRIVTPNEILAKVSRVEVARHFLSPPPERMLRELVTTGVISESQAALAAQLPLASDLTAEADSGGHTDNRPALSLLPTMLELAGRAQSEHGYPAPVRVGAAGGIATPASAFAAFAMGAAYVVTGSVNQACVESGSSDLVRKMLCEAGQADVTMAPAADMFEMGVKVQVLKRGTMFPMRAARLYDLYRRYPSLESLPDEERASLERTMFRASLEETWASTRAFFERRDPAQVSQAEANPKHKMALVFRSYLGLSSRWANAGDPGRRMDYQVWCGPSMGAFNEWVKGSDLEAPASRSVATVAHNLMFGAAVLARAQQLGAQGFTVPAACRRVRPRALSEIQEGLA
jgi:trans-AT polyketide synthase, acyltransferase and oxidoreductase domains